jgi:hypothetical protein
MDEIVFKKTNWEDWEIDVLKVLKTNNVPPKLISRVLNRSHGSINIKTAKLGFKSVLSKDIDDTKEIEYNIGHKKLDNKAVGTINEHLIAIKLIMEGFDVFWPFMNNHKTDLLAVWGERTIKIQVKSGTYETSSKRFRVSFTTKDKDSNHIKYEAKDVDFFIVKCNGMEEFYVIPQEIAFNHHYANLYPHRIKQVHKGEVNWEVFRNNFEQLKNDEK